MPPRCIMFLIFIILFRRFQYLREYFPNWRFPQISSALSSALKRRRSFERGWKTKGKQSHLLKSHFRRSKIVPPAISCYLWIPPIPLPRVLAPTCSQLLIPSSSILERFRREFPFLFRRGNGDRLESWRRSTTPFCNEPLSWRSSALLGPFRSRSQNGP